MAEKARPPRIFLSPPEVYPGEREALLEAFDSRWIAPVGPHIEAFERDFVAVHGGGGHAVALASGTAALHLALLLAGVGPGDEVFCSTLTFAASANAISYTGARPVFIDAEASSWNMDPGLLREALEARARVGRLPRAVEVVHVYGQSANLPEIVALCEQYGVCLIEDAAEALGADCEGRPVGTWGRMGAFSFNGNKLITCSGGGMLLTREPELAERARYLSTQARVPDRGYLHEECGYNYRLSNLLAALGQAQLSRLAERIEARRRVFGRYEAALGQLPGLDFMPEAPWGRATRWLTCLTVDPAETGGVGRDALLDVLEVENIEARPVWRPMHEQPVFADCEVWGGEVASRLAAQGLSLPSSGQLSEADQDRVTATVRKALGVA